MCRVLMYLGKSIPIDSLLFKPDNSLITQSYAPRMMKTIQNLAGFGMAHWHQDMPKPKEPILYRTTDLPFYDRNLASSAQNSRANMLIAHVRGVHYSQDEVVTAMNAHPFKFNHTDLLLAHNGSLACLDEMKYSLHEYIAPQYAQQIEGTTDSEWIYALFLSRVAMSHEPASIDAASSALLETLEILYKVRKKHDIKVASPINLFVTNGEAMIATRFVFNYGYFPEGMQDEHFCYHTLWYTMGEEYVERDDSFIMHKTNENKSIILASEPLTEDTSTWIEIPEYSLVVVKKNHKDNLQIHISDIDIG